MQGLRAHRIAERNTIVISTPLSKDIKKPPEMSQFHPVQADSVIFDWVAVITVCFSSDLQSSLEHDVYSRLSNLQEGLIPKKRAGADDDLHRINELIQVSPFLSHRVSKHVPLSGYLLIKSDHWLFQKSQFTSFHLS